MALINVTGRKPRVSGDDGHGYGGVTAGKRTQKLPNGLKSETGDVMYENEFNRAVEKYFGEELRRCGFDYLSCAAGDSDVPLAERVQKANDWDSDLHFSIHANAFDNDWDEDAKGIETYIYGKDAHSRKIGEVVHRHLMGGTKMYDRGVKDGSHLYMIRKPKMPAVLPELGFMDNLGDVRNLLSDAYRRECAIELAKATCEIFGRPYVPAAAPKPAPKKDVPFESKSSAGIHPVAKGDTLWGIAQKYGVTVDQLKAWNPGINPDALVIGSKIAYGAKTSEGSIHTIAKGDTLWALSRKFNCSVDDLRKWNPGIDVDALPIGSKLYIGLNAPKKAAPAPAPKPKPAPKPSYVGKMVKAARPGQKVNFRSRPSWDDNAIVGQFTFEFGFTIIDRVTVGNDVMYKVKNSKGNVFYTTANPRYVRLV